MEAITDELMKQILSTAKDYTLVILKAGPGKERPDLEHILWEHERRNLALRNEGILSIVCTVAGGSEIKGIGIYLTGKEGTRKILDDDPAVTAGVLVYEIHPAKSFPGDSLPLPGAGLNAFASLAG